MRALLFVAAVSLACSAPEPEESATFAIPADGDAPARLDAPDAGVFTPGTDAPGTDAFDAYVPQPPDAYALEPPDAYVLEPPDDESDAGDLDPPDDEPDAGDLEPPDDAPGARPSQLANGAGHGLAKMDDASVWAWGSNWTGELGTGAATGPGQQSLLPVKIRADSTGADFEAYVVTAGEGFSMAVNSEGRLFTWGDNDSGQLGNGDSGPGKLKSRPTPISLGWMNSTYPSPIAAGWRHGLAIRSEDGAVWAWGTNRRGEVGDGTSGPNLVRNAPTRVRLRNLISLKPAVGVAAGYEFSVAVLQNGTVWTWGENALGQLGIGVAGFNTNQLHPVQVLVGPNQPLRNVVQVAAGGAFAIALTSNGEVYSWGFDPGGQHGQGNGGPIQSNYAIKVKGLPAGITWIAAGHQHASAAVTGSDVWTWGSGLTGTLGNGTSGAGPRFTFTPVKAATAAGRYTTLGLWYGYGAARCLSLNEGGTGASGWGANSTGGIGDGTTTLRERPVPVAFP